MRWVVDLILTKKLWMLLWCTHSYQGGTFNPLISFPQNIDLVDNFCVIIYHVATSATFVFDVVSHTHYINVVVSRIFSVSINGCYTVYSEFPLLKGSNVFGVSFHLLGFIRIQFAIQLLVFRIWYPEAFFSGCSGSFSSAWSP